VQETRGAAPVSAPAYAAPQLLAPEDGMAFKGPDAEIRLEWTSVGTLGTDDYYVVITDFPHEGETWRDWQWTKDTYLIVPRYLYDLFTGSRRAEWRVAVWRRTGTKPDGTWDGVPISGDSGVRSYTWQVPPTGPTATPTPVFEP